MDSPDLLQEFGAYFGHTYANVQKLLLDIYFLSAILHLRKNVTKLVYRKPRQRVLPGKKLKSIP